MVYETQTQHDHQPSGATAAETALENESDLDLGDVPSNGNADHHPFRIVSLGTNDFDQNFVQQHVAPLRGVPSSGELESVVKDAGYSLGPSDKADERPKQHTFDLTGLGTQFEALNETPAELIDNLETWIRKNRVSYPERRHIFLPIDQLETCMTSRNIRHELVRSGGCHNLEEITRTLCQRDKASRQRIFAILCMLGMSTQITEFVQENIFDTDLPFIFKDDIMYRNTEEDAAKPLTKIHLFQGPVWSALMRETFDEYQGQIAAPIFKFSWLVDEKVKHFTLKSQLVLPFLYIADPKGGDISSIQFEGGTSVVRKTKIHPAHFNAPKYVADKSEIYFAVKELKVRRGGREAIALKKLNFKENLHLIRLLATYTYQDHYHLVFPWADGNLREFWETGSLPFPRQHSEPSLVLWMSEQILGLTRALELIHYCKIDKAKTQSPEMVKNSHGRHGDLKPENILWFKNDTSGRNGSAGVLKIGDFGFTDFHSKHSKSRVRRSAVDGITYTYSAPEYDVTQQVSPQFDIWSLGCILLNFIIWYLYDWDGIEEFSKKRTAESHGFMFRSDNFYTLHDGGKTAPLRARLKSSVALMFKNAKQHDNCSDYVLDLLEYVETNLLRVDTEKRARINDIVKKFESFDEKCRNRPQYCTSRTRDASEGPGLSEIIEFPENLDEISGPTSTERGPSQSQSPLSPWPSHEGSVQDTEKTQTDLGHMGRRSVAGLGISHDDTQGAQGKSGIEVPPNNASRHIINGQPKQNEKESSVSVAGNPNMMPISSKQNLPNDEMDRPVSNQNPKDENSPTRNPSAQSVLKQDPHNVVHHSPARPSSPAASIAQATSSLPRGKTTGNKVKEAAASSPPKKLRKRAKKKIMRVLDFFLGS